MAVFNLFGKKKKEFKAFCSVSKEPLEKGFGYLLTTADVITSKKYWDNIMTEPDTMSYTINHFTKNDSTATQIRNMIFEKYSDIDKAWMVSDSYIGWFDVDKDKARTQAQSWWENEGQFSPDNIGKGSDLLPSEKFDEVKNYAVMEAGREKVPA